MAASGHAMWHADVSMTSSGGEGFADVSMTLADISMSLADISIDRSTLTGQRSTVRGPICRSVAVADRWAPHVSTGKREKERKKEKRVMLLGLHSRLGRLRGPLGSAQCPPWFGVLARLRPVSSLHAAWPDPVAACGPRPTFFFLLFFFSFPSLSDGLVPLVGVVGNP